MPDTDDEPPRWRELRDALQHEDDLAKFEGLHEEMDRLLRQYEESRKRNKL